MAVPVIKSIGEEREKGKEERRVLTKRRDPSTAELCYSAQDDKKLVGNAFAQHDKKSKATAKRKGDYKNVF